MRFSYKITPRFLNTLSEFYRLHGALYMMGDSLPWKKLLQKITDDRAALSAVALDSELDPDKLIPDSERVIVPKNMDMQFHNYIDTKNNLHKIIESIDTLSLDMFHKVHQSIIGQPYIDENKILRRKTRLLPKAVREAGIYRHVNIIVKTKPDQIHSRLAQLNQWIQENYRILNPIIKAAIIYYLLARIHPYEDGNGRTAKVFVYGILHQNDIDKDNLLVLEEYYIKHRIQYYDTLAKAIETEEITEWIEFFTSGLLYGATQACDILNKLSGGSINLLENKYLSLTKNQMKLIDILREAKKASGAEIGRKLSMSRQYINNILGELMQLGLVTKHGTGRGSTYNLLVTFKD